MRVLLATPAYGAVVSAPYAQSLHQTVAGLIADGVDYGVYMLSNESLVQRARDRMATHALEEGYDRLLFIDADVRWTYPQVRRLLDAGEPVVGGTYPLKRLPLQLNFNLLPEDRAFEDRSPAGLERLRRERADPRGLVRVRHVPAGFLCVSREALQTLRERADTYRSECPGSEGQRLVNFFPVGLAHGRLLSEDWMFCELCAGAGIPVHLDTRVVVEHVGTFVYGGSG